MIRNAIAIIVLWLCCDISLAQDIVVDTVEIHVEGMRPHDISLPRLTDKQNPQSVHMARINKAILNHYDLEAYNVGPEVDYSWFIHSFKFEQSAELIYFYFEAAYVSNRAYDHEWEVYFDLNTGQNYTGQTVDFHALFKPDMYLPFIDSFWKPHTTKALKAAEADSECGSNRYYDEGNRVTSYQILGDSITLKSMSYRDFPTMYWPCAPYVNVKMSVEAIRKYLSPAGRVFLEEVNLARDSKLKVFAANQKFLKSAVDAVFVFGQVDSLYPISMYLKIDQNEHEVSGWYYYDKYKIKIELSGTIGEGVMYLDEKMTNGLGGVITLWSDKDEHLGYFSSQYDINGTWYGPANDVTYPIMMTEFLVSPL